MTPTRLIAVLVAAALPLCAQATFECQTAPQSMNAVPDCEGVTGTVDPELMVKAFMRGSQVNRDLCTDWTPWDDMDVHWRFC